jgi:hypothetical protein
MKELAYSSNDYNTYPKSMGWCTAKPCGPTLWTHRQLTVKFLSESLIPSRLSAGYQRNPFHLPNRCCHPAKMRWVGVQCARLLDCVLSKFQTECSKSLADKGTVHELNIRSENKKKVKMLCDCYFYAYCLFQRDDQTAHRLTCGQRFLDKETLPARPLCSQ